MLEHRGQRGKQTCTQRKPERAAHPGASWQSERTPVDYVLVEWPPWQLWQVHVVADAVMYKQRREATPPLILRSARQGPSNGRSTAHGARPIGNSACSAPYPSMAEGLARLAQLACHPVRMLPVNPERMRKLERRTTGDSRR